MKLPPGNVAPGSRLQLWAIILVTLFVILVGVLVVIAPERMGIPLPTATPAATPVVESGVGSRESGGRTTHDSPTDQLADLPTHASTRHLTPAT